MLQPLCTPIKLLEPAVPCFGHLKRESSTIHGFDSLARRPKIAKRRIRLYRRSGFSDIGVEARAPDPRDPGSVQDDVKGDRASRSRADHRVLLTLAAIPSTPRP
jgi:hypothetical protein